MPQKRNIIKQKTIVSILALLLAGLVLACLYIWQISHRPAASHDQGQGISSGTQNGQSSDSSGTQEPGSPQPGDTKSNSGGEEATTLIAPYGDFISNHHPGANGSPLTEVSVCNTTPGASCQIFFTKGGIVRSLPEESTDRGGTAYWNKWTLEQYGLTAGSWQVKAVASLGNQTEATIDPLLLEVSP